MKTNYYFIFLVTIVWSIPHNMYAVERIENNCADACATKMIHDEEITSRTVGIYNRLAIHSALKITLLPASNKNHSKSIIMKGNKEILGQVITTMVGKTLHITALFDDPRNNNDVEIICFIYDLKNIFAKDSAYVFMASKAWHDPLTVPNLLVEAEGDARIVLPFLKVKQLKTVVKDRAEIVVSGKVKIHEGEISDDAILQATQLIADQSSIKIVGDGEAIAYMWQG